MQASSKLQQSSRRRRRRDPSKFLSPDAISHISQSSVDRASTCCRALSPLCLYRLLVLALLPGLQGANL